MFPIRGLANDPKQNRINFTIISGMDRFIAIINPLSSLKWKCETLLFMVIVCHGGLRIERTAVGEVSDGIDSVSCNTI